MRLIHASSLKLVEFFDDSIPPYAILSHTWGKEEISLQEWTSTDRGAIEAREGFQKIMATCKLALSQGYEYVWADTNCIDKTSSAELSEAINSMFQWYRHTHVCYAYLADVAHQSSGAESQVLIRKSRWFTRGWTLQELLAPIRIEFYSRDWQSLGTRDSLASLISDITGIQREYLSHRLVGKSYYSSSAKGLMAREFFNVVPLQRANVATRLSWLAQRKTTRIEDMAYCMFGILDINMPLLYGEGGRAFQRLQEEIIKNSDDHSLFCWTWDWSRHNMERSGFLAHSPSEFEAAGAVGAASGGSAQQGKPSPYAMTNSGLQIHLPVLRGWDSYFAVLDADAEADAYAQSRHIRGQPRAQGQHEMMERRRLGIHVAGSDTTGRMWRRRFPSYPIRLASCDIPPDRTELFISHRHDPDRTNQRDDEDVPRLDEGGGFAFLTFETRDDLHSILSYPVLRWEGRHSLVKIIASDPKPALPTGWHSNIGRVYRGAPAPVFFAVENVDDDGPRRRWVCEAVLLGFQTKLFTEFLLLLGMSAGGVSSARTLRFKTHHHWISPGGVSPALREEIGHIITKVRRGRGHYSHTILKENHPHLSEYIMPYLQKWLREAKAQAMSGCDDPEPQPGAHNEAMDRDDFPDYRLHSDGFIPHGNAVLTHMHITMPGRLFEWREKDERIPSEESRSEQEKSRRESESTEPRRRGNEKDEAFSKRENRHHRTRSDRVRRDNHQYPDLR